MAGRGSRLRPHTLTTPKPLIPVGGKPIVHRLVEDIASICSEQIEQIAFVIGDFGKDVENELIQVAEKLGAKGISGYLIKNKLNGNKGTISLLFIIEYNLIFVNEYK